MCRWLCSFVLAGASALVASPVVATEAHRDVRMLELATDSGCFVCHAMSSLDTDTMPLAPPYQAIAARYQGDPEAFDRLVDRVLHGTVFQQQAWADQVNMRFMPPNVSLAPQDARALVHWILRLEPTAADQGVARHERMMALAAGSGCFACHDMHRAADSRYVPLAPAFHDIAGRYDDGPETRTALVAAIKEGTMDQPKRWDDVNMRFMPPSVALERRNAEQLVDWILSLE